MLKQKIIIVYLCLFFSATCALAKQDAYLLASLDKNKVTIGDKIKLTIAIDYSNGIKIGQFEPEENLKGHEVKDYKISKERKKYLFFGRLTKKYEYTLSTFLTGNYEIQPFKVKFTTADGKEAECQSNTLKFEVVSLLDRESAADIRDIKPPVNFRRGIIFWVTIFVVPLLLAGYLIYRYNASKITAASVLEKIVDPYEYIISELQKLQSSNLMEEGKIKEFFIQLSLVIRIYLSKVFAVNMLDMTTLETLKTLRINGADRIFLVQLQSFLEISDLVKFAKYVPDKKEIEIVFDDVKAMVEVVKPAIEANDTAE